MKAIPSAYHRYLRNCQHGLPAEVILGSPKTRECRNYGICRINLESTTHRSSCGTRTIAYLRIDPPTGRLLLHFLSCSLTADGTGRHFGEGIFRVADDYRLPPEIVRALGVSEQRGAVWIRRGKYPVLDDGYFRTISVKLQQRERALPAAATDYFVARAVSR